MKDYKVVFVGDRIGRMHDVEPVTFEQVENLDQLASRVEKHARKFLLSSDVGCFVENSITRHGKIFAGVRNVGEFDFTVTRVHGDRATGLGVHGDGKGNITVTVPQQPRCSWDHNNDNHCTNVAEGRYLLWGDERVLCAMHGERAERRIGDLTREEVPF